jgi:hypothetical protein
MIAIRLPLTLRVLLLAQFVGTAGVSRAEIPLNDRSNLVFASVEAGREVLTDRDDFVERMSPFDRASRMKVAGEVSEQRYLEFVGQHVLEWSEAERERIRETLRDVRKDLDGLAIPFPPTVLLVKTTGAEEGGAAYTRANAIVLPRRLVKGPQQQLKKLFFHELFHVLSRANPQRRHELYRVIGFEECEEPNLPPALAARKITNPDAPRNDHRIRLVWKGQRRWMVPILVSRAASYDPKGGEEFFQYLQFRFLVLPEGGSKEPPVEADAPVLLEGDEVSGFYEQVGENTDYIIHPEEILADNFSLLMMREQELKSPQIAQRIGALLRDAQGAPPAKE